MWQKIVLIVFPLGSLTVQNVVQRRILTIYSLHFFSFLVVIFTFAWYFVPFCQRLIIEYMDMDGYGELNRLNYNLCRAMLPKFNNLNTKPHNTAC